MPSRIRALRKRDGWGQKFAPLALLIILFVVVLLTIYDAIHFQKNLALTRSVATDERVWTIAQLEVDHRNLLLALDQFQAGLPKFDNKDFAQYFDIFFSRIGIVESSVLAADIPMDLRENINALTLQRDALAEKMDSLDYKDMNAITKFNQETRALAPMLRTIVLEALDCFIANAHLERERQIVMWTDFLVRSLILISLMSAAVCFSLNLIRQFSKQIRFVQSAADSMRIVYESSMMAVVATDLQGKILLFNPAAEKTFGFTEQAILGKNIADVMIPFDQLESHHHAMENLRRSRPDIQLLKGPHFARSRNSHGEEFPVELSIHADHDTNGDIILIAFIRDVSKQIEYENRLREARNEARRHADARTMFLAMMSHEMRTPLHGLIASLDLIEGKALDADAQDLLATARNCAQRSVSQINDVLELVQIEQAHEPFSIFSPEKVVEGIVAEMNAVTKEKRNVVLIKVTGEAHTRQINGASKTFSRILYNLIGNALKFTENGKVTIELSYRRDSGGGDRLLVSVQDTGPGISQDDQAHIFDLFFTATHAVSGKRVDGTGLGLPIAIKGIERMGGRLTLQSTLGSGSSFSFEIPIDFSKLDIAPDSVVREVGLRDQFSASCLVVDDNFVNLDLTARMLRQIGCQVVSVESGEAAVDACRASRFDFIFIDLNMPGGMSGKQAALIIRADEQKAGPAQVPSCIVALTADTTFGSARQLAENRMDSVLHKPVQKSDLKRILDLEFGHTNGDNIGQIVAVSGSEIRLSELIEFMGSAAARRTLVGVASDLKCLARALKVNDAAIPDLLHRAIGSTGTIGLSGVANAMLLAENAFREERWQPEDVSKLSSSCNEALTTIRRVLALNF